MKKDYRWKSPKQISLNLDVWQGIDELLKVNNISRNALIEGMIRHMIDRIDSGDIVKINGVYIQSNNKLNQIENKKIILRWK